MEPLPALLQARRRLAGEVLASAAAHSAICDDLAELDRVREQRPLTAEEEAAWRNLRQRRRAARERHDAAERRLRHLSAELRVAAAASRNWR